MVSLSDRLDFVVGAKAAGPLDEVFGIQTIDDLLRHYPRSYVEGTTVREVLEAVYAQHGELRSRLADDDGKLRRFVNVYVGGEDIRFGEGLDTPVKDGDEVQVLPAVAGGC